MLPLELAAVNVIAIGTLPVVALADVGVAEIEDVCPAGEGEPGGAVPEVDPPPHALSIPATSSASHACRAISGAHLEVFIVAASPSRTAPAGSELCPRSSEKKLGSTDEW